MRQPREDFPLERVLLNEVEQMKQKNMAASYGTGSNPQRRRLLLGGLQAAATMSLLTIVTRAAAAELACVSVSSESLRESLNYADPSPDRAKQCADCGFYAGKERCGECQIMSGPVSGSAHCDSWSARS